MLDLIDIPVPPVDGFDPDGAAVSEARGIGSDSRGIIDSFDDVNAESEVTDDLTDWPEVVAPETLPRRWWKGRDRRAAWIALSLSLALHGTFFAVSIAILRRHFATPPVADFASGDPGGGRQIVFRDGDTAEATPRDPVGGDQLPPTPLAPSMQAPVNLPPVESGVDEKNLLPPPHHAPEDLIAVGTSTVGWTPLGVPSSAGDAPEWMGLSHLPDRLRGGESTGVSGAPSTSPSPGQPFGGQLSNAGATPTHVATSPRIAAGARSGASSGRRGSAGGLDDRGLPLPEYPAESRRRGEEGLVELDVEVLADGNIGKILIATDSGYTRLNEAAIVAVKKAEKFQPGTIDGVPATSHLIVPYRFVLRSPVR